MGKVFLIIRRELGSYFSTWMGYLIAAAALVVDGLLFNSFALGGDKKLSAEVLYNFFYFASGMSMVAAILLAMRLVSEEKQSGTIVLLYTSPVTERQIIYGKYFSALAFLVFLHVLSLYMPALIFVNGKVSIAHILTGYTGVVLIGATVLSMSLFASVVSSNQLISAVFGAFLAVTFIVMWMLSDVVEPPFKELFSYLAIHNLHFVPFGKGIFHIQHVVFYLSAIFFFLESSVCALEARRYQG